MGFDALYSAPYLHTCVCSAYAEWVCVVYICGAGAALPNYAMDYLYKWQYDKYDVDMHCDMVGANDDS